MGPQKASPTVCANHRLSIVKDTGPEAEHMREAGILAEQAQLLFGSARDTVFVNFFNGIVLTLAMIGGKVPMISVLCWLACLLLALLLRFRVMARFPSMHDAAAYSRWMRSFSHTALIIGLVWGGAGASLFLDLDATRKVLVIVVLAGMAAGAAVTNGAFARAAMLFIAPVLIVPLVHFAVSGRLLDFAMVLMIVVFAAMLARVARKMEASIVNSVKLRQQASDLAEQLSTIADYTYAWENWTDDEGNLLWVNPSVERVTGYSPQDCYNMSDYPMAIIHPDDRAMAISKARRSAARRAAVSFRARIVRKDGRVRWCELEQQPAYNSRGEPFGFRSSIRDVTEQVDLHAQLEAMARTDTLTGLANRRAAMETCEIETKRVDRYGPPLSLALIDIDRFKQINDTHGHAAGDDCLRALGAMLIRETRSTDVAARYGGEEFVLLMPETDLPSAERMCERLRRATERLTVPAGSVSIKMTISVGLAQYGSGESLEALMARADAALYEAKANGRNRIVAAPYHPDSPAETAAR